jgi:hypothetical protein
MCVASALGAVSCGYALAGRGNALPASITIVGVPHFVNQSSTPDIDQALTQAVRQEFQSKGKYRVQSDDQGVHGLLTATITNVDLRPTAFTEDRLPSAYAIVVTANVEFKHVTENNEIIWANPAFRAAEEYQITADATLTDVTAFLSQNSNAQDRLAKKFARDVVTSIFEAF